MLKARKREIKIELNAKVGLTKLCKSLDQIIARNKATPLGEDLENFIEENEFVSDAEDLFECPGGHIWHIDHISDLMNEKARDSVDWLT